jgi:acetyl esterase/lipase
MTLVRLNFRTGEEHVYPAPVHDVLAGYDWIVEHLLPKRGITRPGRSDHLGRIAVCGELIGGSLASMLALTECRIGQPGVVAAAVNNPILDWVDIEGTPNNSKTPSMTKLEPTTTAVHLRNQLFRKPEHYFDPFASPLLFFRSAGRSVPPTPVEAPTDDLEYLAFLERGEFSREQQILSGLPLSGPESEDADPPNEVRRKASKRYPSTALGLRLPKLRISAGAQSLWKGQAKEFAQALKKSHLRQSKASDFGRKVLLKEEIEVLDKDSKREYLARESEAAQEAQLCIEDVMGLWDDSPSGKARTMATGQWLRDVLA